MAQEHYRMPYDPEVDKDIIDWINSFPRNKKGEMVRHAIRYYMSVLEEGETIVFPETNHTAKVESDKVAVVNTGKKERKPARINRNALTGK